MNINIFFIAIILALSVIFVSFKPMVIKKQKFVDTPLFEIDTFTIHELNQVGLITVMKGTKATRYSDRYKVANIDYTDNSKKYIANIKANDGLYKDKDDILKLQGNVVYKREDGLTFKTSKAMYDKNSSIVKTDQKYVLYQGKNILKGTTLS
ncbi:MAG: LPS export ABC transporter periplasmic protein LptC, partial [Epsilonproteobacteria bacterium]|nr:LPS export ABC transporter periplasmic protein LptC [Campylobacterota bacterium]